ncbi:hypothetical protein, partial [Frigoribacterium sp. CFBP 8751]|uniref:hypothetical protein n=1 Tax=Frigoribacterium sp. CFBP 8751 TaxID=2775277 RepID=UPI001A90D73C
FRLHGIHLQLRAPEIQPREQADSTSEDHDHRHEDKGNEPGTPPSATDKDQDQQRGPERRR